jgi:hypothetical protein
MNPTADTIPAGDDGSPRRVPRSPLTAHSPGGLSHALCADSSVLPFEKPEEFNQLHQELLAEFQPAGVRERLLFDDIVLAAWRLERARIYEAAISSGLFRAAFRGFQLDHVPEPADMKCLARMLRADAEGKKLLDYVARMENRHRRTYYKAIQELEKLQALRRAGAQPVQPAASAAVAQAAAACASEPAATDSMRPPAVDPKLASVVQAHLNGPNVPLWPSDGAEIGFGRTTSRKT